MSDRDLIEDWEFGQGERFKCLSNPQEALDYLRFICLEAQDLLPVCLAEVLAACPRIAGVVIPLYQKSLTEHERSTLTDSFPEAAAYLNDCRRVLIPVQLKSPNPGSPPKV